MTSAVFFNGDALQEKKISFQPWPYREDLQLNCAAGEAGLEVIKYNYFVVVKDRSPSLPHMVVWDENCELSRMDSSTNPGMNVEQESIELTSKFLRLLKPISFDAILASANESSTSSTVEKLINRVTGRHNSGTYFIAIDSQESYEVVFPSICKTAWAKFSDAKQEFGIIRKLEHFIQGCLIAFQEVCELITPCLMVVE